MESMNKTRGTQRMLWRHAVSCAWFSGPTESELGGKKGWELIVKVFEYYWKEFVLHFFSSRGSYLINVFSCLKHDIMTAQREDHNWERWWQRNQLGGSCSKTGEAFWGPGWGQPSWEWCCLEKWGVATKMKINKDKSKAWKHPNNCTDNG